MGYDDIEWCNIINPQLTTIHQELYKLGYISVDKVILELKQNKNEILDICLKPFIVSRESVKDNF
jgi:DNA-binding LacI/PurR family transcriptional regulator